MPPTHFLRILQGEIPTNAGKLQYFAGLMNKQERDKASAIKHPLMRDRYIAVRGLLRTVLAGYLDVGPNTLSFAYGEYGKPYLVGYTLYFNLSHSADKLVIAISDLPEIGVDIEQAKSRLNLEAVAQRCFSVGEFSVWSRLPEAEMLPFFYRLWTRKEAFVKAVGRGLALGLDQCEVDTDNGARFVKVPERFGQAKDWRIIELPAGQDVYGAVVAPKAEYAVRYGGLDGTKW